MSNDDVLQATEPHDRTGRGLDVVRQVLDNQLIDRTRRAMGNVDDLTIEYTPSAQPRITAIEVGGTAMTRGLSWPFGPVLTWMARRWGAQRGAPYSIPWSRVLEVATRVRVDLDARDTPALHWERVLRDRIIGRIPGAGDA